MKTINLPVVRFFPLLLSFIFVFLPLAHAFDDTEIGPDGLPGIDGLPGKVIGDDGTDGGDGGDASATAASTDTSNTATAAAAMVGTVAMAAMVEQLVATVEMGATVAMRTQTLLPTQRQTMLQRARRRLVAMAGEQATLVMEVLLMGCLVRAATEARPTRKAPSTAQEV